MGDKKKKEKKEKKIYQGLNPEEKKALKEERRADRAIKKTWSQVVKMALPTKAEQSMTRTLMELELSGGSTTSFESVSFPVGHFTATETVEVDSKMGPYLVAADGTKKLFRCNGWPESGLDSGWYRHSNPSWKELSSTQKKIALEQCAKANKAARGV